MEEYSVYRDYQKVMQYQEQQQIKPERVYDAEDLEGFKILFHVPEPEEIEEEITDDFIEAEKCYDNPETAKQVYELDRFGYFYK